MMNDIVMLETMSWQVTLRLLSSDPFGFLSFLPAGRREWRE